MVRVRMQTRIKGSTIKGTMRSTGMVVKGMQPRQLGPRLTGTGWGPSAGSVHPQGPGSRRCMGGRGSRIRGLDLGWQHTGRLGAWCLRRGRVHETCGGHTEHGACGRWCCRWGQVRADTGRRAWGECCRCHCCRQLVPHALRHPKHHQPQGVLKRTGRTKHLWHQGLQLVLLWGLAACMLACMVTGRQCASHKGVSASCSPPPALLQTSARQQFKRTIKTVWHLLAALAFSLPTLNPWIFLPKRTRGCPWTCVWEPPSPLC